MLSGSKKGLLLFSSLLAALVTSAVCAVTRGDTDLAASAMSLSSDVFYTGVCGQTGEFFNPHVATVAAEFLKAPAADLQSVSVNAKSLPAVPGALFMALVGFLCVSLVKDRRVWLAALAGLLWLGQTGFTALPHLASHLRSKKQIQQSSPTLTYISELEGSFRLRSDIEGTQYIGLLRHLAGIPDVTMSLPLPVFPLLLRVRRYVWRTWQSQLPKEPRLLRRPDKSGLLAMTPNPASMSLRADSSLSRAISSSLRATCPPELWRRRKRSNLIDRLPQFAIAPQFSLIQTIYCSVPRPGQIFPFSPAFIFSRLARGPPKRA